MSVEPLESDCPEDKVIDRIPIFLGRSSDQQLYVLQHPLQSTDSKYSPHINSVRVKPKQQKVEVTVAIAEDNDASDATYATYDHAKAERLSSSGNTSAPVQHWNKHRCGFQQRFVSDDRSPQKALYALCVKMNGAIWLLPANVSMMKPRFDGLQLGTVRFGKRSKQEDAEAQRPKIDSTAASEGPDKQGNAESGELRAVVHRIQQQDDRLEALRKLSYEAFKKRGDQEAFIDCRFVEIERSPTSTATDEGSELRNVLERLTCTLPNSNSNAVVNANWANDFANRSVANCERYVETILRKNALNSNAAADSAAKSARLSIGELIRTVLIRAKVIPFNKLIEYLRSATSQLRNAPFDAHSRHDVKSGDSKRDGSTKWPRSKAAGQSDAANGESLFDTTAILKYLTQYAVLVRGNWVVSSTTLYPDGSKSTRTGVDASILRRGRDLVLYWFTRAGSLKRMDVASHVRMPAEDLDDVIAQVARPNRVGKKERGGWKFLYETDKAFINRFKDTVNQQAGYWDTRFQILCHELKMKDSDIDKIRRTFHEYEKADVENERRRSGSVSPSLSGSRRRRHSSCGSSASSVMSATIRRRRNTATMSSDDDTESIGTQPSAASPSRRGRKRKADVE